MKHTHTQTCLGNGRPSLGGKKGSMAMYDDGDDFDLVPLHPHEEEEEEDAQEKERFKVKARDGGREIE